MDCIFFLCNTVFLYSRGFIRPLNPESAAEAEILPLCGFPGEEQCCVLQFSVLQFSLLQFSVLQFSLLQFSLLQFSVLQFSVL